MIIAFNGFRDEEYAEPKAVFEQAGIEVITASTRVGTAKGKFGLPVQVDIALEDLKVTDYQAVVFVGGPGSYDYFDDPAAQGIANETVKANKILAAICASVSILANAGLLKGKTATCFSGEGYNLKAKGANYTAKGLEIDGKIITADGPAHAKQFGQVIAKQLDQ
ncbi:MAG: DJ-1/PfpI family protein [Candidatus Margulisbacteria bacterium]|nr:DJ-1/PfpI family protein [Candidatus Margulisiibacteriota bacterium]